MKIILLQREKYSSQNALDSVRETYGIRGFVFNGKVYDVGTADNYRETLNTFCRED